jgi:hypothetical protein
MLMKIKEPWRTIIQLIATILTALTTTVTTNSCM